MEEESTLGRLAALSAGVIRIEEDEDPLAVGAPIFTKGFVAGDCVGGVELLMVILGFAGSDFSAGVVGVPAAGEDDPLVPVGDSTFAGVEPWSFSNRRLRI